MADDEARIVSVIGGARRTNRWKVAPQTSVLTLFGRCLLDLRRADTAADEIWFGATSVFATVEIIVPEGTVVQPSGMAFLAGSSCVVPEAKTASHLPEIEIEATTVFGRLDIHTGDPRPRRGPIRWLLRRPPKPVILEHPIIDESDDEPAPIGADFDAPILPEEPSAAPAPTLDDDLAALDGALGDALDGSNTVPGLEAPEPDGGADGADVPTEASSEETPEAA